MMTAPAAKYPRAQDFGAGLGAQDNDEEQPAGEDELKASARFCGGAADAHRLRTA